MKPYRRYRGVAIYRTATPLPGSTFNDNGSPRRPKKDEVEVTYSYPDGYPCSSIAEVLDMIDDVLAEAANHDIDEAMMVKTLNTFTRTT